MAEAGHPVSEPYPLGGAVSLEATLPGGSLFDTPESSTQTATPSGSAGGPGYSCQREPKEAVSKMWVEHSAAPPARETNRCGLRFSGEPSGQEQIPSEHCVPCGASSCLHGLAEARPPPHHHKIVVNAIDDNPRAGKPAQSMKPESLPVHRGRPDILSLVKQGAPSPAPGSDTYGLANHGGVKSIQEAESHSMLACKQPMQLQQCNIITTTCRGANGGEGGAPQPQGRCACISSPKVSARAAGVEEKGPLPHQRDRAVCYGPYIHHANFEDTFAAYCHPQPIPAPSQLLPRLAGVEPNCDAQRAGVPASATNHLTLPRLISSVSETGLDAKHLLRCCNLDCSWISTLPPGAGTQSQKHFGVEECCSSPVAHITTTTRDMGTMTAHKELRDVGVQAGQTATPHVFPQICLTEESRSETSRSHTLNTDTDGGKKPGGASKSPVKEVKWDAEGMTWEVYGASVDPEELGLAIQRHLELQIKETASHAAKLSRQNTNTSRHSGSTGCKGKRSRVISSFRTPACCARSSTAVD